jgi:hypothetical protein
MKWYGKSNNNVLTIIVAVLNIRYITINLIIDLLDLVLSLLLRNPDTNINAGI